MKAARFFSAVDSHTEGMPTRVITGEQGAQRSVVVERRAVRKFGNDKRTWT